MVNIAYFDNAATTFPKPEEVYEYMDKFYRECGVNVGRSQYKLSSQAGTLVNDTRKLLLEMNHCLNRKVVFTHTATEALNIILQGIEMADNYNIYLSPFEHNAVTRIIHHLSKKYNLNIKVLSFDKDSNTYDLKMIKHQFIKEPPHIVIISHASNVFGILAPINEICSISKKHGALNIVDMCQTMGLVDTDLNGNTIDFAVFAGHKTLYAPFGVAGFICSDNIRPLPLLFGGTGVDSANQSLPTSIPEMYEVGSINISAISGLYASLKWIKNLGIENIFQVEKENHEKLIELLTRYDNIRILSPINTEACIGVVSCVFSGFSCDNIGQILDQHNVAVRTGLHCAPSAHKFFNTFPEGTVRFSVSYFNTEEELKKLKKAIKYIMMNS